MVLLIAYGTSTGIILIGLILAIVLDSQWPGVIVTVIGIGGVVATAMVSAEVQGSLMSSFAGFFE